MESVDSSRERAIGLAIIILGLAVANVGGIAFPLGAFLFWLGLVLMMRGSIVFRLVTASAIAVGLSLLTLFLVSARG